MRPSLIALTIALASCAGLQPVTTETVRAEPWLELKTAHAVIHTNVSRDVAEAMARQIERNRRALLLLWGPEVDPPGQLRIVILRSKAQMKHFAREHLDGFYVINPTGPLLVLAADGGHLLGDGAGSESTQVHELAHAVMHGVLPNQPRWLAEGLATYLENVRVDADGKVALGKVNLPALGHVRSGGRVPLAVLRSWSGFSGTTSDIQDRYATAWAWVHFLFNERPQPFLGYLQQLAEGQSDQAAWQAAFTEPDESLEKALTTYLQSGRAGFTTLPLPPVAEQVTVSPLSKAAVHAAIAQLYLVGPSERTTEERAALARPELDAALKLEPNQPIASVLKRALDGGGVTIASHGEGSADVTELAPCPDEIAADSVIEHESHPAPRTRVVTFGPGALPKLPTEDGTPPIPQSTTAELKDATVGLFAIASAGRAKAVVLREDDPGACVLTAWGAGWPKKTTLGPIQRWVSKDKRHAVFILELRSETEDLPETTWVTIATDGKRAWAPLKGGESAQLIAKSAKLRPQSGKLYLDVRVKSPTATVFAFRPETGTFEQVR